MSGADKKIWILLLVFAIILLSTIFVRMQTTGTLLGEDSYYNLRIAETIREKGLISADEFSYGVRPLVTERGFPVLLAAAPSFLVIWLPFVLGLLSLTLFYKIMKKLKPEIPWIASLLLISSPSIIYLYNAALKHTVAVTLILLGVYLYLERKHILALIVFSILAFFSLGAALLVWFVALYFYRKRKINNVQFLALSSATLLLIILLYNFIFIVGLPDILQFSVKEFGLQFFKQGLLAEFGGAFGLGSFLVFLGLFGIYIRWREKYKYVLIYLLSTVILLLTIYFPFLIYYLSFILAGLGAYALHWLWGREWKNPTFRSLIIIVVICGLIFSPVAYIKNIDSIEPNKQMWEAIQFLKKEAGEDVVLSSYDKGIMISYARKQNVLDSNFLYAPQVNQRWNDMDTLFHTSDPELAREILNKYHVTYVYIDKEMTEEIWSSGEREFLFLLRYSSRLFGKIYANEEAEIYLVY